MLFVAAAIFFLLTAEARVKRRRALRAIHELRAIAHVIDMHQLTKDPEWVLDRGRESGVLPPRTMSRFELSRYLDYCSEALSLTGKLAALYIQEFDDPVALQAVNEVEDLTTGLSRKIWQKLMVLYRSSRMPPSRPPSPRADPGTERSAIHSRAAERGSGVRRSTPRDKRAIAAPPTGSTGSKRR